MTLLLAADAVTLYEPPDPAVDVDVYGWTPPVALNIAWTGQGNLQLTGGVSDARASFGGGAGPGAPRQAQSGQLYLPEDAPVVEGCVADVRGAQYVLTETYRAVDPVGSGLDCWVATARELTSWL